MSVIKLFDTPTVTLDLSAMEQAQEDLSSRAEKAISDRLQTASRYLLGNPSTPHHISPYQSSFFSSTAKRTPSTRPIQKNNTENVIPISAGLKPK
jgi:hypothetical protein